MESYFQQHHYHLNDHHTAGPRQMNSALTRYQSAPSSYFSSFTDRESLEEFLHRPTSPETEQILSRFLQTTDGSNNVDSFLHQSFSRQNSSNSLSEKKPQEVKTKQEMDFPPRPGAMEEDEESAMHLKTVGDVTSASQNLTQNQKQQEIIGRSSNRSSATTLTRHNSSPAGLFSSIDVESAYASVMKNMGELGSGNSMNSNNKEASSLTLRSRLPPSSSRPMSSISETDIKPSFSPGLPPRTLSGGQKRFSGDDGSEFTKRTGISRTLSGGINVPKTKEADSGGWPPLAHHRSLPKSLSDMEKLLSDSVPCKIRAKRGCATHPRSIAERVRRTKISERMKRLQDLVPNMDKQTNTADMLDLAVHYIKDLQGRVKALDESCARCKCSSSRLR